MDDIAGDLVIEPITRQLANAYRETRLAALLSDPEAFCAQYEREAQLSDADWRERAASLDGHQRVGFLARRAGEWCGLLCCFRDGSDPRVGELISMWVSAAERRNRVGANLLARVVNWASSTGLETLKLMVKPNNLHAIAFYTNAGFEMWALAPVKVPQDARDFEMRKTVTSGVT